MGRPPRPREPPATAYGSHTGRSVIDHRITAHPTMRTGTAVQRFYVRVPATTANLGPGYDAFGAALGVHLHAGTLPRADQTERVRTTGEGAADVAVDDDNLVWRSFVRFCDEHGTPVPDVALRVANDVPLERGLGSSSAAIVAGLALARVQTGIEVGDVELARLASTIEGHPDNVVPAVLGGLTASVEDDDGDLQIRRVQPSPRLRPVVLVPETRQSTTAARAVLPSTLPRTEVAQQAARAAHVLGALSGLWPVHPGAVGDLLHEPPRLDAMGPTGRVVAALRSQGLFAWLSGAGPAAAAAVANDADVRSWDALGREHGFAVRELWWDLAGVVSCDAVRCAFSGVTGCGQCPSRRL